MTIKEAIKKAIATNDIKLVADISNFLRFKIGYDYAQSAKAFEKHGGVSLEDYEDLMLELEHYQSVTFG